MFCGIGYTLDLRDLMITMTLKRIMMMMMFINVITMLIFHHFATNPPKFLNSLNCDACFYLPFIFALCGPVSLSLSCLGSCELWVLLNQALSVWNGSLLLKLAFCNRSYETFLTMFQAVMKKPCHWLNEPIALILKTKLISLSQFTSQSQILI